MRYALRNHNKIKKHYEPFGDEILKRIKDSLNKAFEKYNTDGELKIDETYDKYPTLAIGDDGNSSCMIVFYVISKQYDVYLLAFKEFVG